jgi:GNAT superfamily N-acetyltransferase
MVEIERAGVKDHGVVTALLIDFARHQGWTPEVDRDRWDRVIAQLLNSDGWLFLLAFEDGEPLGLAAVHWFLTLYGSREQARLMALIVEEKYQKRGTGKRLMDEVLSSARRRGCRELEVCVDPRDEAIERFYARFDYDREMRLLIWPCEG